MSTQKKSTKSSHISTRFRVPTLTVESVCYMLDHVYSIQDPIWVKGIETTPQELGYSDHAEKNANNFMIEYFGVESSGLKKKKGSLRRMLLDRMGVRLDKRKGKARSNKKRG